MTTKEDQFNLNRFIEAQNDIYKQVLSELKNGKKQTHWMWFIFPQIDGLGRSPIAKYYAIKSEKEAKNYLAHALLGKRLQECTETILKIDGLTASQIFGFPDNEKLKSSMTLFSSISKQDSPFHQVLLKYFEGKSDNKTLEILQL